MENGFIFTEHLLCAMKYQVYFLSLSLHNNQTWVPFGLLTVRDISNLSRVTKVEGTAAEENLSLCDYWILPYSGRVTWRWKNVISGIVAWEF